LTGVGNLGVAVIQLVGLLALAIARDEAPYWVPVKSVPEPVLQPEPARV
jgi:nitrate/nitrite transporter NarK